MRELDSTYQGLIFLDFSLEEPELESIMEGIVPQTRILAAVRQSHANNLEMVQLLDSKIRSLYATASGLVNERMKTLRGFGRVETAVDVCQQSILRKIGLLLCPTIL